MLKRVGGVRVEKSGVGVENEKSVGVESEKSVGLRSAARTLLVVPG